MSTKMPKARTTEPRFHSLRARLVVRYVVLLTIGAVVSVLLVRQLALSRANESIDRNLEQEVAELRQFAGGIDPRTGSRFGDDPRRIFTEFLRSDIPEQGQVALTFIDGRPYKRTRQVGPFRLDRDRALVDRWARLDDVDRGSVRTRGGPIEFLAVPLESETIGSAVYVVAIFRAFEGQEVEELTWGAAGVGLIVVIVGAVLAWRVAHRSLAPVGEVTRTAQAISESDLARRIEVQGDDEIAHLAATFNEMLDRIESSFGAQRNFISDAGHELRTPITIITGHLETLDEDPDERAKTIELLLEELDRMARMVDDLLVLTKAERPDFLVLRTVDLGALTRDLITKMAPLGDRAWSVERVGEGVVIADPQRLTQAMMQLGQNAVEHSPAGDAITLGSEVDGAFARLWIRDTGSGLAPEDLERIFERFARGRRRSSEGTGLGLSIVKAIVEAHGGRVRVDSVVGRGSTFIVEIPADGPFGRSEDGDR